MSYFTGVIDDNRGHATRYDIAWTARILSHRKAVMALLKEVLFSRCTKIVVAQLNTYQNIIKLGICVCLNRATALYRIYCVMISKYFVIEF